MTNLITNVNVLSGNYSTVFLYTLNASFSGITSNNFPTKIEFITPEFLDVYLGDFKSPISNVTEEIVTGGKKVIFQLDEIKEQGISIRLGFGFMFKKGTPTNTTFKLNSKIVNADNSETTYENEEIKLILNPEFTIKQEMVIPTALPTIGGEIYYKVTLENIKDLGSSIKNATITCSTNDGIFIDNSFTIIGFDASSNEFKDSKKDNLNADVSNNTVVMYLDNYSGEKYEFIYKALITENYEFNTINSIATLVSDDINKNDSLTIELGPQLIDSSITCYGPSYTTKNEYIGYEYNIQNTGNKELASGVYFQTLPSDINYYEIKTPVFKYNEINSVIDEEYTIDYTTENENNGTLGPYKSSTREIIDLSNFLNSNDNIKTLKWNLFNIPVGALTKNSIHINGFVKDTASNDLFCETNITYTNAVNKSVTKTKNKTSVVSNTCSLKPTFTQTKKNTPVKPGELITYTIGASCSLSRLQNPFIAFVLPKELTFLDNSKIIYNDNSLNSLIPILPEAKIINNFSSNQDTLIIYEFKNNYAFNFRQKSNFKISFDVEVNVGAIGEFKTYSILGLTENPQNIAGNVLKYYDQFNVLNYQETNTYAKSTEFYNQILFFVSTKSNKKVKGELDSVFSEYPNIGKTIEGGSIKYEITIENTGNANLTDVEIIDILPHVNDSGVILTNSKRNSDFNVYAITDVTAKIYKGSTTIPSTISLEYSKSYNPVRFGPLFNTIGLVNDWNIEPPESLTEIKSIKILTKDTILKPGEILLVMIDAVAPPFTESNKTANNSFAANITYEDLFGNKQKLLAIEPEMSSISVNKINENKGQISGFTWIDKNKTSLPDSTSVKVNDVGVILVNGNNVIEKIVFTTPNANNENGYYSFSNLNFENYYLVFFALEDFEFTKENINDLIGSKVNQFNRTNIIELNENNRFVTANAGLIEKEKISTQKLLTINKSANSVLKSIIKNQMLITMKIEKITELRDI